VRRDGRMGLIGSAADAEDDGAVSDRWAQAQPLTISTMNKIRNAMRRDKKKPFNKAATYSKFIGEMESLLARLVPLQLDSSANTI
jgi:hypothetical protein